METIQTYTPVINNYGFGCYRSEMEPDSSGEWVSYEDYKKLAKELQELREELQDLHYELKEERY